MIRYGVWNGIKYDNTLGDDKAPEGLDLKALKNFNPGNPIDVVIGNAGFLVFDDSVSLAGVLLGYYEKVSEASCGRCTPCRTGSRLIELALRDLVEGRGAAVDWDHIYGIGRANDAHEPLRHRPHGSGRFRGRHEAFPRTSL